MYGNLYDKIDRTWCNIPNSDDKIDTTWFILNSDDLIGTIALYMVLLQPGMYYGSHLTHLGLFKQFSILLHPRVK